MPDLTREQVRSALISKTGGLDVPSCDCVDCITLFALRDALSDPAAWCRVVGEVEVEQITKTFPLPYSSGQTLATAVAHTTCPTGRLIVTPRREL